MKKKVKLLTSIASLGLALALMTFGVLAAVSNTVAINGTVSFVANDVFADITGHAYLGVDNTDLTDDKKEYTATTYDGNIAVTDVALDAWEIGDIAFSSADDTVIYVLQIHNANTERSIEVDLSTLPATPTGTTLRTKKYMIVAAAPSVASVIAQENTTGDYTAAAKIEVPKEEYIVFVFVLELTNKTVSFTSENGTVWNSTLTIANKAA